jgi:hypothetical protein
MLRVAQAADQDQSVDAIFRLKVRESHREDSRSGAEEKDVRAHSVSYMVMIYQSESSEKVFELRTIEYKMTMLIRSEPSIYPG